MTRRRVVDLRVIDLLAARITTTQIVTMTSVATGVLLAMTGGSVVPFAPWFGALLGWPWVYGTCLAFGGLLTAVATGRREHAAATIAALITAAGWGVLATGFIALWFDWIGDGTPGNGYFPPYPAAAYAGYVAIFLVHADTEARAWRAHRRGHGVEVI